MVEVNIQWLPQNQSHLQKYVSLTAPNA